MKGGDRWHAMAGDAGGILPLGVRDVRLMFMHPSGQLFNTPCVVRFINELAGTSGFKCSFVGVKNTCAPDGRFVESLKEVCYYPLVFKKRKEPFMHIFAGLPLYAGRLLFRTRPHLLVTFGLSGLIIGSLLSRISGTGLVYYNLEIYGPEYGRWKSLLLSMLESRLLDRVSLLVIHDSLRLGVYEKLLGKRAKNVAYFPNAPVRAHVSEPVRRRVAAMLDVRNDRKYIVYSGGLYPPVPLYEYVSQLGRLPDEWAMIFQSYDGESRFEVDEVMQGYIGQGRLIINRLPLDADDYASLLSFCRIGLSHYSERSLNMNNVGLSSGKIAAYWRAGLPILVNSIPFYREVLKAEHSGMIYGCVDEIPSLVESIEADYQRYSQGASACFNRYFDLTGYTGKVSAMIRDLVPSLPCRSGHP